MNSKILSIPIVALFFLSFSLCSQSEIPFGQVTNKEKELVIYEKDPSANAIFLYEIGNNYFKVVNNYIRLVKEYHVKVKILNEQGFDQATISIPFYKSDNSSEKIINIEAVTHNNGTKSFVLPDEIYTKELNQNRNVLTFTFPKVKVGSILEYKYTLHSPFIYGFNGWEFQSDIPKIYSEFNAKIPGNYIYNRALIGNLPLDINESRVQKNCFHVPGFPNSADCEILKYAMSDIPAFTGDEDFMLSESNYKSKLDFELSELRRFDGRLERYTKTWDDVDKEFRSDKDIGRQLTKKDFFEKNVPSELLSNGDDLTKAKNIFKFIQQRYTWNEEYGIYGKVRVKEAYEEKKGNVGEINMSLINLLNAAEIPTQLVLLSTRTEGLPKKVHPVMSDFNYMIAKTTIDGKEYLLDATDKYLPFGYLPYRALNYYGRVMDFKNESYWYDIKAHSDNMIQINGFIDFNTKDIKAKGVLDLNSYGYEAVSMRKMLDQSNDQEFLDSLEDDANDIIEITEYELNEDKSNDTRVSQRLKFEIQDMFTNDVVYFNPFLFQFFDANPFIMEKRSYPVDFGYTRNYKYRIYIKLPEAYKVKELPESKIHTLGDNLSTLKFICQESNNQVSIIFEFDLAKTFYSVELYTELKSLFDAMMTVQDNSLLVFEKK
ncbi:DUF3857 domain-containing protein [Maribacter sp. CXY002]|uniref:DUF3857 domain-containing protein n=1 Tax=Maribacter luteocoastalis TaxID=3407671 RepID=UPI003B66D81F